MLVGLSGCSYSGLAPVMEYREGRYHVRLMATSVTSVNAHTHRCSAKGGRMQGTDANPGPSWAVNPGQRLCSRRFLHYAGV